ncbi:MAG: DsbA family protein [Candidatus Hydrothermarchaeales archaeon]
MEKTDSDTAKIIILGLVAGLVLGGVIGYLYFSINTKDATADVTVDTGIPGALSQEEIRIKAEDYINQNLLQPGAIAKVEVVTEKGGVYELQIAINSGGRNQSTRGYVSMDGTLFFIDAIDMTRPQPKPPAPTQPPAQETTIDMKALIDDDPWAGDKDAEVIIVEFSDFQCPFCARAAPTVNQIKKIYGDKVLFVYRDFPLSSIHPQAQKAAEASQCAFEQDKFWEYHDLLFEKQQDWAGVGVPKFKEYAADLGLDTDQFNGCLDSGKHAQEVTSDLQRGQHLGVTGTPTFFINGKKVVGAQPFSVFQGIIDDELAKTG